MIKKVFISIICFSVFFPGCASIREQAETISAVAEAIHASMTLKDRLPAPETLIEMAPLKIRPGYIYFPLRADMIRQQEKTGEDETKILGLSVKTDLYEPVPYRYNGLDLGDGIFIDTNMNLSLDFAEVTGFSKMENCTVTITEGGFIDEKTVITRRGDKVKISVGSLIKNTTEVNLSSSGAEIDGGFFSDKLKFKTDNDSVTFIPGGLFGFLKKERIERSGSSFKIPGFIRDKEFARTCEDGSLQIYGSSYSDGNYIKLRNEGKKISIFSNNMSRTFSLIKSREKIVFYDDILFTGFMLEMHKNEIVYTQFGEDEVKTLNIKIEKN